LNAVQVEPNNIILDNIGFWTSKRTIEHINIGLGG